MYIKIDRMAFYITSYLCLTIKMLIITIMNNKEMPIMLATTIAVWQVDCKMFANPSSTHLSSGSFPSQGKVPSLFNQIILFLSKLNLKKEKKIHFLLTNNKFWNIRNTEIRYTLYLPSRSVFIILSNFIWIKIPNNIKLFINPLQNINIWYSWWTWWEHYMTRNTIKISSLYEINKPPKI